MGTLPTSMRSKPFPRWVQRLTAITPEAKGGSLVGQFPAVTVVLMLKGMAASALGRCMDATRSFQDVGMCRCALDMPDCSSNFR